MKEQQGQCFLCLFLSMCDLWHLLVSAHIFISIWTNGLHFLCYQSMATFLRTYLPEHSSSICLGAYISPRGTLAALQAHVEGTDVAICVWCLRHQVVLRDEIYLADSIWEWTDVAICWRQLFWFWFYFSVPQNAATEHSPSIIVHFHPTLLF